MEERATVHTEEEHSGGRALQNRGGHGGPKSCLKMCQDPMDMIHSQPSRRRKLEDEASTPQGMPWALSGDWCIRHIAGKKMVSDIGTKPLPLSRMVILKIEMGMLVRTDAKTEAAEDRGIELGDVRLERTSEDLRRSDRAAKALQMLALAVMIGAGRGEDGQTDRKMKDQRSSKCWYFSTP